MTRVAAVLLAAGTSSRMGSANKLLVEVLGRPLVVTAALALQPHASPLVVVTGHDSAAVRAALAGHPIRFVHNDAYAEGMATSIRAGVEALPEVAGVLVCLADMPRLQPRHVAALVAAFAEAGPGAICVPTCRGRRGHPVLFGAAHLGALCALSGDRGGRALLDAHRGAVREVPIDDDGVLVDVDTPADLEGIEERARPGRSGRG